MAPDRFGPKTESDLWEDIFVEFFGFVEFIEFPTNPTNSITLLFMAIMLSSEQIPATIAW